MPCLCVYQVTCFIILTYFMEQSPWKTNRFSASQEIPRTLWNPKVYHIHKCPPPVPILNQIDLIHTPTSHFLKIHLNIILPASLGLPNGLFPSGFPTKTQYTRLFSPFALHSPPISFFSILSPEKYWRRTDLYAPHFVVFSTILLHRPF